MTSFKKTESGKRLSEIMKKSYMDNYTRSQNGAFIIWIGVFVPAELFLGFENIAYYVPESHAATTAAKGLGASQCEKAESHGYSMDLCSYPRIDIGTAFDGGKGSPVGGMPKPDLIVSNNNNCTLLVKWFEVFEREWEVPHFIMDIPFCYDTQKRDDLEFIVNQYKDLIKMIEKMSGQRFDLEKVKKSTNHSINATKYWKEFLKNSEQKPSGITGFDSFVQMAPFLTMRGTEEFEEHYRLLAKETSQRCRDGIVPIENEKYRLLWDGISPWHQLKKMQKTLAEKGANIITASYTYCIGSVEGEYDPAQYDENEDTFEILAKGQNFPVCAQGMNLRRKAMKTVIERNKIDGIVFSSNRSCKPYSLMQLNQQRFISDKMGIPSVMIDVDHADSRSYNEDNVFLRIDALLEQIDMSR